jgi:16S rRNA (guanine527-N7)-methyltransferase
MLTDSQISSLLDPYGFRASAEICEKIGAYIDFLLKWNRKIALTTVTDPIEIVRFHFGESLFAISTGVCGKSRLADVGTGAGFPGLALAIADSDLSVTLIESNLKKCAFLNEVIRQLSVRNASVIAARMESVDLKVASFDWVAARALGQFDQLLTWTRGRLAVNGKALMWLGEKDVSEISSRLDWTWDAKALIPGSERRFILMGAPKESR